MVIERRKAMAKSYEEKAKEAIQDCYWRKNIHGVSVCAADLCPCIKVIEDGKCSTLIELFKNEQDNKPKSLIK